MSWQSPRNATGPPVEIATEIGRFLFRAATGYNYGAKTYMGLVQTYHGPGDWWNPGEECNHRHLTAEAALACAQRRIDRLAAAQ